MTRDSATPKVRKRRFRLLFRLLVVSALLFLLAAGALLGYLYQKPLPRLGMMSAPDCLTSGAM